MRANYLPNVHLMVTLEDMSEDQTKHVMGTKVVD